MNSVNITLVSNASANGDWVNWPGGKGYFAAEATWGGGSVKLQFKGPNGTAIDYTNGSLSANGGIIFELPAVQIRAAVTTSTAAYATARGI
jgi:hypothetical protein